jgi:HPt (histidine-containing phosphotransfer) domain-containing protein
MININSPETVTQQWSQPLIDLSELLLIIEDDQALLKDLLTKFYQDYLLTNIEFKQALQENQLLTAQRHAHNIAGSAQMLGANTLRLASQACDYSLKQGYIDYAISDRFTLCLDQTLVALNKKIAAL